MAPRKGITVNIIEFLNKLKDPIDVGENKQFAYAITDGYNVIIYDPDTDKTIYETDTHSIVNELMAANGLEDQSP